MDHLPPVLSRSDQVAVPLVAADLPSRTSSAMPASSHTIMVASEFSHRASVAVAAMVAVAAD